MLTMRITGGKYCGRKVIIPTGELEIRPAMDRMRDSLFAILGPLDGASFCDLFSGSGCVGLEAASRGASVVHLVEMDRAKREVMEKNIDDLTAQYGSVKNFLREKVGLTDDDFAKMKKLYLED